MGGGIIGWAIRRPVTVTVGVILVLLFGALSIVGIPIQLTPDVTIPTVSVSTTWPGATPTEIESEILEKQEEALKSLPGLVRMKSEARGFAGNITLELEVGSSIDQALVRASNLLSQVADYPDAAREPIISTADSSGPPMAVLIIQSSPPGREVAEYRSWVEDFVVPRFERIRGVASIRVIAGSPQELHIDFDPQAVAARGLSLVDLIGSMRQELADVSAGDLAMGKRRYQVRTQVIPDNLKDLERLVLAVDAQGTPVELGHVAKVSMGLRKKDAIGLVNGSPSMALLFFRESGFNVLEVTEEIHRVNTELQTDFLDAEGLEMRVVSDQSGYIKGALNLVRDNLVLGGILAIVVLLIFLRSVGASLVVAISIPISVVGTVLAMAAMGRTVNVVSLAGMAFAVGMVVDNSIVVLENIDTWRQRGVDIARSSLMATKEVWGAILASTLTTAAVFVPIITWQDEVGELLRDIAVAVSTAVFVSLIVSVIVIPSLSARLLRRRKVDVKDEKLGGAEELGRVGRTVFGIVSSPLRSLLVAGFGIGGAVLLSVALLPPMEYLPTGNRNIIFGVVIPPPGYSVEEMQAVGDYIQGRLVPHVGREVDGVGAIDRTFFVGSPDQAFMGAVAEDPARIGEVNVLIRQVLKEVPGVIGFANQGSLFGRNLGGGRSIEVDISGSKIEDMVGVGGQLMGALSKALPGAQIRPIPGLDAGAPELRVEPIRSEAARFGFTGAGIGLLVDAYVDGAIIGELGRPGEPKRDVVLRSTNTGIDSPEALAAAAAATPSGQVVPIGKFAHIVERLGPTVIQRIERRRAITLQIAPPDNLAFEDAIASVRGVVANLEQQNQIPEGIDLAYSGSAGKLQESKRRFAWVLLLAVLITYLLLAALFEDFLAPVAILVTVPLAGAGGVLGLWLVNRLLASQPLDMMTALGFVLLVGVVVNNAILIVDGALSRMREHHLPLDVAVASAVKWRVRPILMSVLTSLAGLTPLVIFPGAGSELYRGVGGVVLGGLALSTLFSLFVVPALFTILWRLRRTIAPVADVEAQ